MTGYRIIAGLIFRYNIDYEPSNKYADQTASEQSARTHRLVWRLCRSRHIVQDPSLENPMRNFLVIRQGVQAFDFALRKSGTSVRSTPPPALKIVIISICISSL